ncbi:hypothetical protein RCO27_00615 [Sphingosinicella sp. LHD-64]|uniref:hypothetical protein n=1 Tax=Sphingosinicella sp. LHD-64 TaxID=3072139 RepID=UPI00280E6406|nr:hypothetical protein [Sphingosinicella sp. LHD-64]MDQ8754720.1 hypothetical protein [Sphingosinicella sp. LHD-64]
MGFELERVLYETEDFLRRNLGSRAQREAKKRKAQRAFEEAMRRLRRAGLVFVGIVAALIVYSLAVAPIGFLTWIVALPTALLFALLTMFWPSRRRRETNDVRRPPDLGTLAARVEEGLLDRRAELPGRALPAADAILSRLNELQPHLDRLDPASLPAGDARRLIGEHMPRLVDTYLELPPSSRAPGSEASQRFTESLGIVADELGNLLDTCCRDKQMRFDTQNRFIETRYREDFKDG